MPRVRRLKCHAFTFIKEPSAHDNATLAVTNLGAHGRSGAAHGRNLRAHGDALAHMDGALADMGAAFALVDAGLA